MDAAKQTGAKCKDDPKPVLTGNTCQKSCSLPAGGNQASLMSQMMRQCAEQMLQSADLCTEHLSEKDDIIKGLEAEVERLKQSLLQCKESVVLLQKKTCEQKTENCKLRKEMANLEDQKRVLQADVSKLKRTNVDLKAEVDGLSQFKKENDLLSKRLSYLSARHDTTTQQLREEKERADTVTREHQAQLEALNEAIQKNEEEKKRVETAMAENQVLNYALKEQTRKTDEARKRVDSVTQEKQALSDKLTEQRRKNEALEAKLKETGDSIVTLVSEKKGLQDQVAALQGSLLESQQKIADTEEELMQKYQQLQGVAKFTLGVRDLMQELRPLDIVSAASGERNSMDGFGNHDQVTLESIDPESDRVSPLTISCKDLRELPQLPANVPDVTMNILVYFTAQMGGKWDFIAYALGVGQLASLLIQSPLSADSKCLNVLQTWIEQGPEVTWPNLLDALWRLGLRSTALAICDKLIEMANDQ